MHAFGYRGSWHNREAPNHRARPVDTVQDAHDGQENKYVSSGKILCLRCTSSGSGHKRVLVDHDDVLFLRCRVCLG